MLFSEFSKYGEIVDSTDNASDCGGMIKIKFDNGYEAKFCHLSSRSVEKGEFVLKGQEIGKSGGDKSDSTSKRGNSEDAHLHFELCSCASSRPYHFSS